jgi:hypothetical protein
MGVPHPASRYFGIPPTPQKFRCRAPAPVFYRPELFLHPEPRANETKGNLLKMAVSRSKAEQRYAEIQKREHGLKQDLDKEARLRLEKTARLRQLRLAKEAEDAAAKQAAKDIKTAGKTAFKKTRQTSAT